MKKWNIQVFDNLNFQIESLRDEVWNLDVKVNQGSLLEDDVMARTEAIVEIRSVLRIKESQVYQRSKAKWFKEGNAENDVFHANVKSWSWRNTILSIRVSDTNVKRLLVIFPTTLENL